MTTLRLNRKSITGFAFTGLTGLCAFAIIGVVIYVMLDIIIGGLPGIRGNFLLPRLNRG